SFENRKRHTREDLVGYAVEVGLDRAAFEKCLDSEQTAAELAEDIEIAHKVRVKATPTIVVNGVKFEGLMPLDRLQQSLDRSEVCACDLKTEFCEEREGEKPASCDMEVVGGPPSCEQAADMAGQD
ncbi:MAG: thioredoxin domain-containing protein, partial [Deltaproteobacteria bacterium]|nr:thioredoxin domain-containing protein [Deltaproteobacteria bacterium]